MVRVYSAHNHLCGDRLQSSRLLFHRVLPWLVLVSRLPPCTARAVSVWRPRTLMVRTSPITGSLCWLKCVSCWLFVNRQRLLKSPWHLSKLWPFLGGESFDEKTVCCGARRGSGSYSVPGPGGLSGRGR